MMFQNLIAGECVPPTGNEARPPVSAEASFKLASPLDLVRAIQAANRLHEPGKNPSWSERLKNLEALRQDLATRITRLASTSAQPTPADPLQQEDVRLALGYCDQVLNRSDELMGSPQHAVVAGILPQCFPLANAMAVLAPAMLAGSAVILKPSTKIPNHLLMEWARGIAGTLPPGGLQILWGSGAEVGALMTAHPGVDLVCYFGSTEVGLQVANQTSSGLKNGCLWMSVKNSALVLDDAPLDKAAEVVTRSAFVNEGQGPWAVSRVMISEKREKEFLEVLTPHLLDWKTKSSFYSHPRSPSVAAALRKVREEKGLLLGEDSSTPPSPGPTVIHELHNCSDIHQTDLQAPVLVVVPTKYQHESVKWANTTPYGHSHVILTEQPERAQKVADQLVASTIQINNWDNSDLPTKAPMPLRQSGWGSAPIWIRRPRLFKRS